MFLTLSCFSQNIKALDDKYGFRESKFESLKSSFCCLTEIEESFFISTTEKLTLGEYKLDEVVYNFFENKLSTIMIKTKGYTNSRGVLKILQNAYGMGYQSNKYIEEYYWRGAKVTMIYDQNSITDDAIIYIWSITMRELEKNSEEAKTKKASGDL